MRNNTIIIESVDIKKLSNNDFNQIAGVEKDMWASGIWEYIKCNNCWQIHSKEDIFWHLSNEIRTESVVKLEEIFLWDSVQCNDCNSTNTDFIFDINDNINIIMDRYNNSINSFLSLAYDEDWEIIWLSDWYIDNFVNIFNRELSMYYWEDLLNELINNNIFNNNEKYFCWASLWIVEKNRHFITLYNLMKQMYWWIDSQFNWLTWFAETADSGFMNKLCTKLGSNKVELLNEVKYINKNIEYVSHLYYQNWLIGKYKNYFKWDYRAFVTNYLK